MKITLLTAIGLAAMALGAAGQSVAPRQDEKGRWGFVDASGREVVKPTYTDVAADPRGYFLVAKGGKWKDGFLEGEKWGVVDPSGKVVLKADYDEIGDMINGAAMLGKDGKYGFVDKDYRVIVKPEYNFAGTYNEQGLTWVCSGGKLDEKSIDRIKDGRYGIVDLTGRFLLKPEYKVLGYYPKPAKGRKVWQISDWNAHYYSLHKDEAERQSEEAYGRACDMGRLVEECGAHACVWAKELAVTHGSTMPATSAIAFAKGSQLRLYGVVLADGTMAVPIETYSKVAEPSEGFAIVMTRKGKTTYYDIAAKRAADALSVKGAFAFNNGRAVVCDAKGRWRFLSRSMAFSSEAYRWISPLVDGNYLVSNGETMAMLDGSTLKPVVEGKAMLFPPSGGKMLYKDGSTQLWGFLNADGSEAHAPAYAGASSFDELGISVVDSAGRYGMVDRQFASVLPTAYRKVVIPTDPAFTGVWAIEATDFADHWRLVDCASRRPRFEQCYTSVTNFADGVALVGDGAGWGYINADGTVAIPLVWKTRAIASNALRYKQARRIGRWREVDTVRYRAAVECATKKFQLSQTIIDQFWDY